MKLFLRLAPIIILVLAWSPARGYEKLGPPDLGNNPGLDVVVTNPRPVLSFYNAKGGVKPRAYTLELSPNPEFTGPGLLVYENLFETDKWVTTCRIKTGDQLQDKTTYYWRVRATDGKSNQGPWAESRFLVDIHSDDHFMGLSRAEPKRLAASSGYNPQNVCDLDDPGQVSFWQSAPFDKSPQWVELDLGKPLVIQKAWVLSNPQGENGRLLKFSWQYSHDRKTWETAPGTEREDNYTHRNILDFSPQKARYWRIKIDKWQGYCAQINALTLYTPEMPPVHKAPQGDYVLIVGDQKNGYTFTQLERRVLSLGLGLETLVVPHFKISLKMVESLTKKPVAIILSGNNADYTNLPMFEYNGVYELIRKCPLPILGICCGHQLTVMAHGITFARGMGFSDITDLSPNPAEKRINIITQNPLFQGIESPFSAPEIHGWAVYTLPENYEVLARSSYIQSIRSKVKPLYGVQFHPEIETSYNQAMAVLKNFLLIAIKRVETRGKTE
ncbi:glutamine amidotransferase-related protein [Dethiosulfatarculus sandiegensis]|uniref:GMP synthase n=1 Tax=Dethiosulfatarculus sandiegensis TaxID=1429043 RepID=A0A0D2J8P3_9BACT|nr:discoidin domain-containing protein [Dethiosulfatarculus sandiegensis]KIX12081.1 GMP synthase [Dethiosulfatarculus sandiegensis]